MRSFIELFAAGILVWVTSSMWYYKDKYRGTKAYLRTVEKKWQDIARTKIRVFRNPDSTDAKGFCIMETTLENLILAAKYNVGEEEYELFGGYMLTAYGTIRMELEPAWKTTDVVDEQN